MHQINIEIKARCRDVSIIRNYLTKHNADYRGRDHQVDTYFVCKKGRLKLREGIIESSLIHYERPDIHGPKQSTVTYYKMKPKKEFKEVLLKSLDVLVTVDKQREIFFIGNVKFHIDEVEGLGWFIEIEAIDGNGSVTKEKLYEQCQFYMNQFGIYKDDLLHCSYSDMLLGRAS